MTISLSKEDLSALTPSTTDASVIGGGGAVRAAQAVLVALLGDLGLQIRYLGLVFCIDAILGAWAAIHERQFALHSFIIMTLRKLAIYLMVIILFNAADVVMETSAQFRRFALIALLSNDIFSSLKNIDRLGYRNLWSSLIRIVAQRGFLPPVSDDDKGRKTKGEPQS